jgi:periplasmic copper chaperone A
MIAGRSNGWRMRRVVLAAILIATPVYGFAQQNGIKVENAWSRAAMAGRTGVVYLTIVDTGAPDRLVGASAPVARAADLHESFTDHGVTKMRAVAALPVEPGKPVTLAPNSYHIMLTDLKQPLNPGDSFPLTLTFEKAGPVTATVAVQKAGASVPTSHDSMDGVHKPGMPMQGGQRQ